MTIDANIETVEALDPSSNDSTGEDDTVIAQSNHNGWVNPEDLTPMPQCIAQQDQSTWLSAMTRCTSKRCTSHFGIICTHHQWLTQLTCLGFELSPSVIKGYLPYCSRSVLAKAQLYQWVRKATGRTWLVDIGDTNGLGNLSPASLAQGYAAVDVIHKAPTCLSASSSASSMEAFQHVIASCSFTETTRHTGNEFRAWEYSEPLRSMIALDSETVGYDLTQHGIRRGDYFDKECFCSEFTGISDWEPCAGREEIDLTKERLWMHATCGLKAVPDNWNDGLKTTAFAFIPVEDWVWPTRVADMPKQVVELADQCATDACEIDSGGYCRVVPAVDRACFCRDISYDSCGCACQMFETRADYVHWLHGLCGNVQGWHGLPEDWQQLAAPTPLDMIPWRWSLKPSKSNDTDLASMWYLTSSKGGETCPSTEWKLGSFALINIATFLAPSLVRMMGMNRLTQGSLGLPDSQNWVFAGISIAALQLLANWFNVSLVHAATGYGHVPVVHLMLLWCTMPRLTLLRSLVPGVQPLEAVNLSAAGSCLLAEIILQGLSSYYMIITVNYGREHSFYAKGMERLAGSTPAQFIYAGALLWLIVVVILAFAALMARRNEYWPLIEEKVAYHWIDKSRALENASLMKSQAANYRVYGTLPVEGRQHDVVPQKASRKPHAVAVTSVLLCVAQWLFWGGFITLSLEE
ncbi:uncharacterized protein A1O9_05067 [Exophiala aquamarina CBS 119918]|uniref:Uncharacterized protein n=1 Tax=Exophiala aquamarina CBS 119918 TaxID=1182545 RepID=A0A072PKD9_9EURO|nr:uncharacterized protein A1O9_05067 [Exophiala aquamarina CBS 119918]KEF60217.1 hypothetical protein A1O9_05067 [Exophiala aquamarina CBS 119918]